MTYDELKRELDVMNVHLRRAEDTARGSRLHFDSLRAKLEKGPPATQPIRDALEAVRRAESDANVAARRMNAVEALLANLVE